MSSSSSSGVGRITPAQSPAGLPRMELNVAKESGTALPCQPGAIHAPKGAENLAEHRERLPLAPPLFPGSSCLVLPSRTAQEWRKRS